MVSGYCISPYYYLSNWVWKIQEKEFSYKGIDCEVGYIIWHNCGNSFYGAIGPYFYQGKGLPHIYGGQLRLEFRFLDYLSLEGRFSNDNHFYAEIQGKLMNIEFIAPTLG